MRSRLRMTSLMTCLIETFPPIFSLVLIACLTTFTVYFSPGWIPVAAFVVIQIGLNWIQFLRHKSVVPTSTKNFPGYVHRFPSAINDPPASSDPEAKGDYSRKRWNECDSCDLHVPVRARHCHHCRRCIFIKDHHCYFLGSCVGRRNQRFFLVFCFYACIGCSIGVWTIMDVMRYYRDPLSADFVFYLLPVASVMYLLGKAQPFEIIYTALLNFGIGAALFTLIMLIFGFSSVFSGGTTPFEDLRKKIEDKFRDAEREDLNKGPLERFRMIFGPCGLGHFLIPLMPYPSPEVEVGYRRIITYNSDFVMNGLVIHCENPPAEFLY